MILNEFIKLTGYNRSYAARALRIKRVLGYLNISGKRIKRKKKRFYDKKVLTALKKIEMIAIKNKTQVWVFGGIKRIKERLPFSILRIDSDNGNEFINDHLLHYCQKEHITFTRSRPYRKNDSCFVEQKNYSVIRRTVGYSRYDTDKELSILNELYSYLRLYTNFFQPVRKLIKKERIGSKVIKRYDEAKAPYRRVLASLGIEDGIKVKLKNQYAMLIQQS